MVIHPLMVSIYIIIKRKSVKTSHVSLFSYTEHHSPHTTHNAITYRTLFVFMLFLQWNIDSISRFSNYSFYSSVGDAVSLIIIYVLYLTSILRYPSRIRLIFQLMYYIHNPLSMHRLFTFKYNVTQLPRSSPTRDPIKSGPIPVKSIPTNPSTNSTNYFHSLSDASPLYHY